ncbi:TPA: SdhB [Legionella pneumophila subsp. pneumophila]|uniref:SdhB n=1 Tax=Legionella pneumophila TaxID=446 RepID=UPI0009B3E1A4|nr:SdhB [Legionella pneumophila]HCC3235028.1 SdhB [Legionella pneumophila subsp. pneumophila]HAT8621099.1 SdhB [Legionella pneumophila]HAU9853335.1 SdhB [Legionella pneumophila]HAU9906729.1 SdhB [Legionella pneumophila]HAV0027880.1 SdhB [Legionella pneumophila]
MLLLSIEVIKMPDKKSSETLLSQQINEVRGLLLQALKTQLDDLVAEKLIPQPSGVPFVDFEKDPPQIATLKKVINCLYHAEEAFKSWESIDTSTLLGKAKAAPKLIHALTQIYKSLGLLDEASPEIRSVIADNYHLLEPLFTQAYAIVQESGWLSEFMEMDVTDKASKVIFQGMDLLGPDVDKWHDTHPLVDAFSKISKLVETISTLQEKDMPGKEKEQAVELIRALLDDLDNNPFISKLSISDFEDSKAIKDLLEWFKNIQDDGFDFSKKSIKQYVSWANHYLPTLIAFADQLERQNYLKPGSLSANLCSQIEHLGKQVNDILSEPGFGVTERVVTIDSLQGQREQKIHNAQVKSVQVIMATEKQLAATADFYQILEAYKGMNLSQITEPDRRVLRQLYPQIQTALAHASLDLENQLTSVLNTTGPEKTPAKPKSWWELAKDGLGYVASYVVNYNVDKILGTRESVDRFLSSQIASEQFKILIAEKAREKLRTGSDKIKETALQYQAEARLNAIKSTLRKQPSQMEAPPSEFVAVKPSKLVNLRGTLTAIQEMQLSTTVNGTRTSVDTLIHRHLPEKYQACFSTLPYQINENDPELVKKIKTVENNLFQLEKALKDFEKIDLSYGIMIRLHYFIAIASAASKLKSSVKELPPEGQKALAPLLQQIMTLGLSFSDTNYTANDLSALQQLKMEDEVRPKSPSVASPDTIGTLPEETGKRTVKKPKEKTTELLDYADKISNARASLLNKFKNTLSPALADSLDPQKNGVPFVHLDQDPPQIAAIKKIINSMYHAECALKTWHGIDTSTTLGKVAAAHQGVAALSQVYKSFTLFTEDFSDIHNLIRENHDLIAPVIIEANKLVNQYGWARQFSELDIAQQLGSILGQGINTVQPKTDEITQTASLVKLFSEIPRLLNNISSSLDQKSEKSIDELRISNKKIEAIGAVFELFFEENAHLMSMFKGFSAISGLIELNKKIQLEGTNLQEVTIRQYQSWLKEGYPNLMMMLDEIETRHYLTPGFLSAPIALELDQINDKLNEIIETKPDFKLQKIPLSFYMGDKRIERLMTKKTEHCLAVLQIEEQKKAVNTFFGILKHYSDQPLSNIKPNELAQLRLAFVEIQSAMANSNFELSNDFVAALNQLETSPPEKTKKIQVTVSQLLKVQPAVETYLNEHKKSSELKIAVIDKAIEHVKDKSFELKSGASKEINIPQLRRTFLETESKKPVVGPGELKPTSVSSLNTVRGNLAYIQELKMSSTVGMMREQFSALTRDNFSNRVQKYLIKPQDKPLHMINDNDPLMVRQIKEVENGLYHLETALKQFEQMKKSDSLVSQTKALLEIANHALQLKMAVERFSPELKEHYGPLVRTVLSFSNKIQSINYNKEDWADLQFILNRAHKELLKRKTPRDHRIEKAFFEAGVREVQIDRDESVGKKAAKLGVKYAHLASPQLEKARAYLSSRYKNAFGQQPKVIRSFTREQLANEEFMDAEISRLKETLEEKYGFNIATIKVLLDLLEQIQRAGAQAAEVAGMVNTLVTYDFPKIKENAYRDLLTKLSQEEDYLNLKPGTLINPAMAAVNQLFLSAALELDMPFSKKLSILDDTTYVNILIRQTESDLQTLKEKLSEDPSNHEIAFEIEIKNDKLAFLRQQMVLLEDKNPNQTRNVLMDMQFEVSLRNHLVYTTLKAPIAQEYEQIAREYYKKNKNRFLYADDCSKELLQGLKEFEKKHLPDHLIVFEAYDRLRLFSAKLPPKNQDVKEYIENINRELQNRDIPIRQRALKVKLLPNDTVFIEKLISADKGTHFLRKFMQFITIITASITEAIKTGGSLVYIYRQKQMEQSIKNIEKSISFKEELHTIKDPDGPSPRKEEGQEGEIEFTKL